MPSPAAGVAADRTPAIRGRPRFAPGLAIPRRAHPRTGQTGAVKRSAVLPSPVFLGLLAATVAGGLILGFGSASTAAVDWGSLLLVLGGWGVSLSLHEFGHAIVAYRGGDYSVRAKGYLTLDVRRYTDPVFSLLIPLLFLLIGGIPLPGGAVWINQNALRSRGVRTMVSLAGPLANLVIGALLALVVRFVVPLTESAVPLIEGLSFLALLQVLAFVLNILPVPGLDGWGAIEPYLGYEAQKFGAQVRPWAPMALFVLLLAFAPVSSAFFTVADHVFDWVGGYANAAYYGQQNFLFWKHF